MGKATPAAPRPGGGRRSWHESRERPKEERRTRQAGQWFLTLAALGLTALLTTLLIPSCRSRTMLVTITAAAPDRLVVAPIAFAVEDTAAVRDVPHDEMAELLDKELTTLVANGRHLT